MKHTVIIGAQWGDEGKGKIVDVLAQKADIVVRFNGGNNAGHTVVVNGEKFPLSLLPSGVLWKKKLFLSQGVVVTPEILVKEIEFFIARKLKLDLAIDPRVNVVMPYHKLLDAATEESKGDKKVGSLKLGIGYCYEDRNNRHGIRMSDLIDPKIFREKVAQEFPLAKKRIEGVFGVKVELTAEEIFDQYIPLGKKLKSYVKDVSKLVSEEKDSNILFEGAHGTFLDGNFGTYPYTTAVNTISGSVFSYVGMPPEKLYVIGVVKAYTTRVGGGPFTTELSDKNGEHMQVVGGEFGTVSKRKRRCGWLDAVMLKYAQRLNGFSGLALTKLDVLTGLPRLKIAVSYIYKGKETSDYPVSIEELAKCKPVYKEFKGWKEDISYAKKFGDLPKNCQIYVKAIEKMLNVPIKYISVGAERRSVIKL
ncbi:MAG: Adenylosuccinate synthetase [Candidatus Gottesmanbacteria bacterium GW2011_GWC2_39_8]|uniref:Adenylosuccinate synthetase n=1 Tax=Candidatus Gottesmanbacteria bacterium GW2011_GWC2_39_8 TaxID=1618450 RepID=A0A0G0SH54_9BACT|nr:MAG: Adenylosuccinate synthetase [Candidatus Gottesmanbacteria bacterium GW2011_GWC2_39_8]